MKLGDSALVAERGEVDGTGPAHAVIRPERVRLEPHGSDGPNRVPGTAIAGAGMLKSWFNTAAFVAPATGTYGNATRNSIELPGTVSLNGVLSRTFSLGETRNLEARIQINNAFNTVQYAGVDTTINSQQYGQVTSVTGMRSFVYTARYRF